MEPCREVLGLVHEDFVDWNWRPLGQPIFDDRGQCDVAADIVVPLLDCAQVDRPQAGGYNVQLAVAQECAGGLICEKVVFHCASFVWVVI